MVSKQAIFQCAAVTHPLLVFCRCSSSTHNGCILKRNEMFTLVLLNVRNTKRKYNKKGFLIAAGEKFRVLYIVFTFENESIKSTIFYTNFSICRLYIQESKRQLQTSCTTSTKSFNSSLLT